MRVLITGGAGFIGSHTAEFFAKRDKKVTVLDDLSKIIGAKYNWNYLKKYKNIDLVLGSILEKDKIWDLIKRTDIIIHTAAQTAVTTSIYEPDLDFDENTIGTFEILEAARKCGEKTIIFCSTNKVYGDNINKIDIFPQKSRYIFKSKYKRGIPETFPIDLCTHTPYGCSKLAADLYMQEYAHLYSLKVGIFRMSCIYGERQFGAEDQGWVAWFAIATALGRPITIYGDGKQVRDILHVGDLLEAYQSFVQSDIQNGVFNIGGGPQNTISLLELLDLLEELTGKRSKAEFADWRAGDQRIYISDIGKARRVLKWSPKISSRDGIERLVKWVEKNAKMLDYLNQL